MPDRNKEIDENNAAVGENPGLSIPRRSLELGISQTSLQRISHKDFGLKAFKVQLTQELKLADHQRRSFADRVISGRGDHNWPPRSVI